MVVRGGRLGVAASLSKSWTSPRTDTSPHAYGLASDGQRVLAPRKDIGDLGAVSEGGEEPDAELTAYDGATGKLLWQKTLPWIHRASPVGNSGTFIVPSEAVGESGSGPESAEYVALDSATGAERWRVQVSQRVECPLSISHPGVPLAFF